MTRWTLKVAKVATMVGLLIAGIGVSAAHADPGNGNANDPPTTVPGSPGDDCSHGNSGAACRPDPNQNGKDCQDHGNAKGNEDHCDQAGTTTTTETTPTSETETTETTIGSTITSDTTTNSSPPGTPPSSPGNSGSTSSAPAGAVPASALAPPVTTPVVHTKPAQQVKGAAVASQVAHGSTRPGELPFTGFPTWAVALIGSLMVASGLGLRRVGSLSGASS